MLIMNKKDRVELNGMKVFPFSSPKELLGYVDSHKGILVAVNEEKSHYQGWGNWTNIRIWLTISLTGQYKICRIRRDISIIS